MLSRDRIDHLMTFFFIMSSILLLVSCGHTNDSFVIEDEIEKIATHSQTFSDKSPPAKQQTLPRINKPIKVSATDKRFDVSVNGMDAKRFFLSLVSDLDINIVTDPEVSGKISLKLKNVTIEDVLDITRDVHGYEYKKRNNIYIIYPRKLRTEVFTIDYLDVEREGNTETTVVIGRIESGQQGNSGAGRGSNRGNGQSSEIAENSGSQVKTLHTNKFWEGLAYTIENIVGGNVDGRMVATNPQAGLVVVKAFPKEIRSVRDFLEKSALNVKRQVILEAKILEVSLNDSFESGINWNQIQGQILSTKNVETFDTSSNILSAIENESLVSSIVRVGDISQLLSLLQIQGSVQVLSSPRVSTVNNQKALIRVGSDEFFVTGVSSNNTTSAAATTITPEVELTSFFSGISLDVTPQIAQNGDVILHVHPIVSEVQDQEKVFTIGDEEFALPLALRDIRESDSIVRAANGEVVVLGGLMQERTSKVKGKRPILGDIPILNLLFKTKNAAKVKTELVILLRPIVVDDGTWNKEVQDNKKRFKQLSNSYNER